LSSTSGTSGLSGTTGTSGLSSTSGTSGLSGTTGTSGLSSTSGTSGLSGTTGTSGLSGLSGTTGTSGLSGTTGTSGLSGLSGTTGTSGLSGTTGTSGLSGLSGTTGTSGLSSTSGTSGLSGTTGTSGRSGTDGTSGRSGTSGTSGLSGTTGTSGLSGTTGTAGISGTSGSSGFTNTLSGTSGSSGLAGTAGTSGTSLTNGVTGTGSIPYLSYWNSTTGIASTKAPANLGFYFDSGTGNKYAINGNTVSTAALSIFNHNSGSYITPPVLSSIGTTLLTQVNGTFQNQYDLSQGFIYYYSGTSTDRSVNLIVSKLSTTGGVNESFEFLPGNYGDHNTNSTTRKVIISANGIRSGYINTTSGIEATTGYHFHAGKNNNSVENGTIAWDGRTSGTLAMTVTSVFTSWTMTLPSSPGSSGQFLQTDGTGVTTWATAGGGGGLSGGTTNYVAGWSSSTTLSSTSSIYLDKPNNRIGFINMTTPQADLHINEGTGLPAYIKFTAGTTTGTSSTDGFDIGITSTGGAEVRQREASTLSFFTGDLETLRISGSQSFAFGKSLELERWNEFQISPWSYDTSAGSAQVSKFVSGTQTTGSGTVEVYTTGNLNTAARIKLDPNHIAGFMIDVVAYNSTDKQAYYVRHRGLIAATGSAGQARIVGAVTTETIYNNFTAGASSSATGSNTNGNLLIQVSGLTGKTIRWMAVTELYEINFA
jgi:hypothetical protein